MTLRRFAPPLLITLALLMSPDARTAEPAKRKGPGVVVVAGGGPEGELDETDAWSYPLYKKMIENGDINGDKKIKVTVISFNAPPTNFVVDYLKGMGATTSENVVISSREQANDPKLVDTVADADVIFFRGGNQADAYRAWKGSRLHQHITKVRDSGGAFGGTSSGAMSLAGFALAGGQDIVSMDVLQDSHSPLLLDEIDQSSSIHDDFINIVPNAIIDTHVGERARLGRLIGVQAKAVQDSGDRTILAIGVEERTGIAVYGDRAEVHGTGAVQFIQTTPESVLIREPGKPLVYSNVRVDLLTDGWVYDLKKREPDTSRTPSRAEAIRQPLACSTVSGAPQIRGNRAEDEKKFSHTVTYGGKNYAIHTASIPEQMKNVIGFVDAHSDDEDAEAGGYKRAHVQAAAFRALYDHPKFSTFLIPAQGKVSPKPGSRDEVIFARNSAVSDSEAATMILDCKHCTHRSLSPRVANMDNGSETLRSAGIVNMRVHVLADSARTGASYNVRTHEVMGLEKRPAFDPDCLKGQSEILPQAASLKEITNSLEGGCQE